MTADDDTKIQFKITYQNQSITFNTKKAKPMVKAFQAFADRMNMDMSTLRFYYNEQRLRPETTPTEINLEDGDEIDATLMQQGGRS